MRLTLLVTSPRVAPGLMSWSGWQTVAEAGLRLARDPGSPLARAVAAAGHPVVGVVDVAGPAAVEDVVSVRALLDVVASGRGDVVWLADDEDAERLPRELATVLVDGSTGGEEGPGVRGVEVEVLHGSYDVPGARLLDLVTVMDQLRRHCPWDREQTHRSLAAYLLEETYETLEAIETDDAVLLREELGDLLLQVVFHSRVASERDGDEGGFDIDVVAGGIVDKLVHRHPHVFAGLEVTGADEVDANWERLKAAEKGRASVLDGVPMALPALALAEKVVGRAARVGVVPGAGDSPADRLLALVVEARAAGRDPEQELRGAVRRLADAVRAAETAP